MPQANKKAALLIVWLVLLGGLLFGITHFNSAGSGGSVPGGPGRNVTPEPEPPSPAVLAKRWPEIVAHAAAPARGNPHARYTLAEFGDFQCPQCGKARPLIEQLLAQYPNQVNLIFIHRPFPRIHHWAIPAAEASAAAAAQGKFWPMYDALYSHQDDLEPGFYSDYAAQAGLKRSEFDAALKAPATQQAVQSASKFSDSLGVQETPTVILHDNVQGTAVVYVGLKGNPAPGGASGIRSLAANPPWVVSQGPAANAKS